MIKRFHEAPCSCFKEVQSVTDGDYCLVHLLLNNEQYFKLFQNAVMSGREVILDNSVFELGTAFDIDVFAQWVQILRPTYYIIPDVLDSCAGTLFNLHEFIRRYPDLPGKRIGVVQGSCYTEIKKCYTELEPLVDKVAFSMDSRGYGTLGLEGMMIGRQNTLYDLFNDGIINPHKKHHLLGVALPQEMTFYRDHSEDFEWIDSVDTSNPVLHGLKGIRYHELGLSDKDRTKMCDCIDDDVSPVQLTDIMYNIERFRRMCNGE